MKRFLNLTVDMCAKLAKRTARLFDFFTSVMVFVELFHLMFINPRTIARRNEYFPHSQRGVSDHTRQEVVTHL
jgi:hypothetical protein